MDVHLLWVWPRPDGVWFMSLDPVLCADGCGRPADRERPYGMDRDGDEIVELVCGRCGLEVT